MRGPSAHYAKRHNKGEVDDHHAQRKPSAAGDSSALDSKSDNCRAKGNTEGLSAGHGNSESLIDGDHERPAIGLSKIPQNQEQGYEHQKTEIGVPSVCQQ